MKSRVASTLQQYIPSPETRQKMKESVRRARDLFMATGALVITSPVYPLIALAIKLESRGPVFYLQERVGQNQERFMIRKFRSMHLPENRTDDPDAVGHNEEAITKVGWFLRKFTLDELPQLLHVLSGHMQVVGPRPLATQYIDFDDPVFQRSLEIKPGLISEGSIAKRHSAYEVTDKEGAAIDNEYEARRTFISDMMVLIKSVAAIHKGR